MGTLACSGRVTKDVLHEIHPMCCVAEREKSEKEKRKKENLFPCINTLKTFGGSEVEFIKTDVLCEHLVVSTEAVFYFFLIGET